MRNTYMGMIQNDQCNIKTLVLAESAAAARAKVLAHFSEGLGKTYREEELQIIAFGA